MTALRQPAERDIVLVRRAVIGEDELGDDLYGETRSTVRGLFAPGGTSELVQGQNTVITQPTAYLFPPVPDLSAVDAVEVDNDRYEIDGDPGVWDPGVVLRLQRVTG